MRSADAAIAIVSNFTASILLVSRDTVPKQIMLSRLTVATHYSCTVLVSLGTVPSVSTPCALGDSETHNAGSVGNQSQSACQTPHSACVRRPIRFPTATDCRLYHRACLLSETIYRSSHTPIACMQNGFEQLNTWLSRLHSLLIRQVALVITITN